MTEIIKSKDARRLLEIVKSALDQGLAEALFTANIEDEARRMAEVTGAQLAFDREGFEARVYLGSDMVGVFKHGERERFVEQVVDLFKRDSNAAVTVDYTMPVRHIVFETVLKPGAISYSELLTNDL